MQRISITNPQNIIDGTAKKYYFKLRNTGGPKGDKGDKGDTGATGPQGAKGDPCTVVVNSTATLEPGSNAYVTNTGSLSNAVLNFGIPQGPQGPQGAKGDKGDTGAKGETGPRGPQGERGTNATVYVGTTSTLNPGSQATVYNSGTDSNAVLNFGIPRGAKGDTGSQGPQGPQGPTGPAGQNFAATVVTELPETGDSSKLYLTPKAHTTQTATGNPITASVTEQAGALESFQLDGDTYQQSYTGKNLFGSQLVQGYYAFANGNYSSNSNAYVTNKDKISVTAGATYTISANKGVYGGSDYTGAGVVFFNNGTYVSSILRPENGTFTVPSGANQVVYNFYKGSSDENITPSDIKWVQLESGSSATSYEPYVGGTPSPNPDYPQPIQTVTGEQTVEIVGKNLFDKDNMNIRNGYLYSTTFSYRTSNADRTFIVPCEPNTTYTISRSVITSSFRAAYIDLDPSEIPADASSETSLTCAGYIANNSGTSITITTSATAKSLLVHYGNTNTDGVTLIDQSVATIMVEKSASATAYAPYSKQILPINLGKNLLNTSLGFQYGFIDNSGAYVSNNTIVLFNQYIEVSPATEYRFSSSHTNSNMTAVFYDSNKTFISRILVNTTSVNNFTTPINCRYVRLQANYNATEMSQEIVDSMDLMLSAGSQATTYAPYKTPIELCKLGNYQDYIYKDGDSWKVHKATKKLILDGSEEWLYYNGVCQLNSITDYAISNNTPYCGAFSGNSNVAGLSAVPENSCCFIRVSGETTPRFYVRYESKFSSANAISQYLTTNPTSLYYSIATATDSVITDTALISQLEAIRTASLQNGANTITNTATGSNLAGDMEIGYYGYNPTNRYDKWLWLDINNNYEQIGS